MDRVQNIEISNESWYCARKKQRIVRRRWLSFVMLRPVVWSIFSGVSEELTGSIIRAMSANEM
jgi:hypothetical protein